MLLLFFSIYIYKNLSSFPFLSFQLDFSMALTVMQGFNPLQHATILVHFDFLSSVHFAFLSSLSDLELHRFALVSARSLVFVLVAGVSGVLSAMYLWGFHGL
jgi:nucleoporin NDC1